MGWFDEQIRQRMREDDEAFAEAFAEMAQSVTGRPAVPPAFQSSGKQGKDAIDAILRYYHTKPQPADEELQAEPDMDIPKLLDYYLRPSGIMHRTIILSGEWYKDAIGAILAEKDGVVMALIPQGLSGYSYLDPQTGKQVRVNKKNAGMIAGKALCFYRPFPLKQLGIADLLKYIAQTLSLSDFILTAAATLAVTLLGLLLPMINKLIFSGTLESGDLNALLPIAVFLLGATISKILMSTVGSLITERINAKMNIAVQSAAMMRVLSLPAAFFKNHSPGELSTRISGVNSLCSMLVNAILSSGLTSLFSLIYIGQITSYSPALAVPALVIIFITAGFSLISTLLQMKLSQKQLELAAQKAGLEYGLISGIQKIKLSGAEKRAFAKWAKQYKKSADLTYNPPLLIKLRSVIETAISLVGMVAIYYFAVISGVGTADYMAFNVSFGMVSGAFMSLSGMTSTFAAIRPTLENVRPLLRALPEIAQGKKAVRRLFGGVEINNVVFRYSEGMPLVLDNLSLKIRPGQYVAIAGKTGCGKSTLMRILLGFETPQKGAVYYDGQNIEAVDIRSLRRRIGVVLQDGKLFQGSIYSNITISAPWLSMDEAWKAAEAAGIAPDIRRMPMGMHTVIQEGGGGISGGQRQRLMIARAIAPKPKILMFDEATSALDNITQKIVSDSLAGLKCTRIVIAHRLSTIQQCDRIIVLDKGKIAEDGSYDDLIAKNGFFAELVERQRLDG